MINKKPCTLRPDRLRDHHGHPNWPRLCPCPLHSLQETEKGENCDALFTDIRYICIGKVYGQYHQGGLVLRDGGADSWHRSGEGAWGRSLNGTHSQRAGGGLSELGERLLRVQQRHPQSRQAFLYTHTHTQTVTCQT